MDYLIMYVLGMLSGIAIFLIGILWLNWRYTRKKHDPPTKEEWKVM